MNHIDIATSRRLACSPTGCPEGVEPHLWRKALSQRVETHLALATALLNLLDDMSGDCDLEENGDLEPSLAGSNHRGEYDLERDDSDLEPWLGAIESSPYSPAFAFLAAARDQRWPGEQRIASGNQTAWSHSDSSDREDEHDGAEPENEHGPGWTEFSGQHAQLQCGGVDDDEEDSDPAEDSDPDSSIDDHPHDGELDLYEGDAAEDMEPDNRFLGAIGRKAMGKLQANRARLAAAGADGKGILHGMVLKTLPELYGLQVAGDCLHPEVPDGSVVHVSTTENPRPGDFVVIYRWARFVQPGEWQVLVKRLVLDIRNPASEVRLPGPHSLGVLCEMLNPPTRLVYPAEQVEAVHKVVSVILPADRLPAPKVTAVELARAFTS